MGVCYVTVYVWGYFWRVEVLDALDPVELRLKEL